MVIRYVIPILSLAALAFGVFHVVNDRQVWSKDRPPVEPPGSPYSQSVAGTGVIEAQTQNIAIGSPVPGVVVEVFVQVGQRVGAGTALFRLDDRHEQAELRVQESALALAKADLERLDNQPRPEQLPIHEAMVQEAQANLANQEYEFKRIRELFGKQAAADEEVQRCERSYRVAEAQMIRARAELALLKAGSWELDKSVARVAVTQAEARVAQVRTELDRLVVRALVDGQVLQVNVRAGEFVGAPAGQPLIVLGNIEQLHVRVDIDEYDIPRFRTGAPAVAMLKGSPEPEFPLKFVRVEPFVIPKKSLSGDVSERVDTRVLQVIYSIDSGEIQLYVGQQLDVFVNVSAPPQ